MNEQPEIPRPECLLPATAAWQPPTPAEFRYVLTRANLTGGEAARVLGLGDKGSRTIRRWAGGESEVPYSAWALLCEMAGLGCIWHDEKQGLKPGI